ncbi:hypothetical protein [Cohnella massiliensis]|uniref:hypothetical protein n=1 Tax=Cohnella massiliensis TaxID=1816691 RepID=UPI003CCB7F10
MSVQEIAKQFNTVPSTVYGWLQRARANIRPIGQTNRVAFLARYAHIADDIIQRYRAGDSVLKLSKDFEMTRGTVSRILSAHGIEPRNASEATKIRLSKMTASERIELTSAAHEARRGSRSSQRHKINAAKTQQRKPKRNTTSHAEDYVAQKLAESGFKVSRQLAIGPYNADIAVNTVAVEIFCGNWHASPKHATILKERTRYLFNSGWNVLIIRFKSASETLSVSGFHQLVAFLNFSGSDPAAPRQYRMIGSDGKLIAIRCAQCDDSSFKPSFNASDKVRCDHLSSGE